MTRKPSKQWRNAGKRERGFFLSHSVLVGAFGEKRPDYSSGFVFKTNETTDFYRHLYSDLLQV